MAIDNAPLVRLTRRQAREVDRLAVEKYHMPSILLMENAARSAADVAQGMLPSLGPANVAVLVLCGGGNNGGDGLAIARHLHNAGRGVSIQFATDLAKYQGDALANWEIVRAMGLPAGQFHRQLFGPIRPWLLIDALFGTGLTQVPRDPFPEVAAAVNASGVPVLAVDLPSGLDCDTGEPLGVACIRATKTITFVAEKAGFANPASVQYTGEVVVGDIGCPRALIDEVRRLA